MSDIVTQTDTDVLFLYATVMDMQFKSIQQTLERWVEKEKELEAYQKSSHLRIRELEVEINEVSDFPKEVTVLEWLSKDTQLKIMEAHPRIAAEARERERSLSDQRANLLQGWNEQQEELQRLRDGIQGGIKRKVEFMKLRDGLV